MKVCKGYKQATHRIIKMTNKYMKRHTTSLAINNKIFFPIDEQILKIVVTIKY